VCVCVCVCVCVRYDGVGTTTKCKKLTTEIFKQC